MKITTDNASFKNRNRGKVKTLIGSDEVFMSLLDFKYQLNGKDITIGEILDDIYNHKEELDKKDKLLQDTLSEVNKNISELKSALRNYIATENKIDKANTASIELLSSEINKINTNLNELNAKCNYM